MTWRNETADAAGEATAERRPLTVAMVTRRAAADEVAKICTPGLNDGPVSGQDPGDQRTGLLPRDVTGPARQLRELQLTLPGNGLELVPELEGLDLARLKGRDAGIGLVEKAHVVRRVLLEEPLVLVEDAAGMPDRQPRGGFRVTHQHGGHTAFVGRVGRLHPTATRVHAY